MALYQKIINDPANLTVFAKMPSMQGLSISDAASAEQQQGEFEILTRSGPIDNPQLQQVQQQIMEGTQVISALQTLSTLTTGEIATPQGSQLWEVAWQIPNLRIFPNFCSSMSR